MSYLNTNVFNDIHFGTSKTQTTQVNKADVEKLYKYANGVSLTQAPDTFVSTIKSGAAMTGLMEGLPFLKFLRRNKKNSGKAITTEMKALTSKNKKALKNLFKGEGGAIERVANYVNTTKDSKLAYDSMKSTAKMVRNLNKNYDKLVKLVDNPEEAKKLVNKAMDFIKQKGDDIAKKGLKELKKTKAGRIAYKTAEGQIKTSTAKAATKTAVNAVGKSTKAMSKLSKFGKFMKSSGAGIMLVFSGISEIFTEIRPTFKELGKEKGMKQIAKSTIKVVGDTVGFIAGEYAGTALGTAIGTAIFPGIGTVIGAAVGFLGGIAGSFIAGKITNKITGPSEREIAQKEREQQEINNLATDNQSLDELKARVEAKIAEELATTGQLSEDSTKAQEALNKMNANNPFIAYV